MLFYRHSVRPTTICHAVMPPQLMSPATNSLGLPCRDITQRHDSDQHRQALTRAAEGTMVTAIPCHTTIDCNRTVLTN